MTVGQNGRSRRKRVRGFGWAGLGRAWLFFIECQDWLCSALARNKRVVESEVTLLPIVSVAVCVCILRFSSVAAAMAVASMRALLPPAGCSCSSRNGGSEQELASSMLGNASSSVFGDSLVRWSTGAVRWSQKASASSFSSQPVSLLLSQWNSRGSVLLWCVSIGLPSSSASSSLLQAALGVHSVCFLSISLRFVCGGLTLKRW